MKNKILLITIGVIILVISILIVFCVYGQSKFAPLFPNNYVDKTIYSSPNKDGLIFYNYLYDKDQPEEFSDRGYQSVNENVFLLQKLTSCMVGGIDTGIEFDIKQITDNDYYILTLTGKRDGVVVPTCNDYELVKLFYYDVDSYNLYYFVLSR